MSDPDDPASAAVTFTYGDGAGPGYTRRRHGKRWDYFTTAGKAVRAPATIARLEAIALPPAYRQAWYARDPRAHLQATGIDARGRKQYRYHPAFRALREAAKFAQIIAFGRALPRLRAAVETALGEPGLTKTTVIAAVVRLLDRGRVRIGNSGYARANGTFGATTLQGRHAKVQGRKIMLDYVGKSGIAHSIALEDAKLAQVLRRCQDQPGQPLFQYRGEDDTLCPVTSDDVNAWLREQTGASFTAKDFRTWGASTIAFGVLAAGGGQARLKDVLEAVARQLGNTPPVARRSYIHPLLIEAALDPPDFDWHLPPPSRWLTPAERGLLGFLRRFARPRGRKGEAVD